VDEAVAVDEDVDGGHLGLVAQGGQGQVFEDLRAALRTGLPERGQDDRCARPGNGLRQSGILIGPRRGGEIDVEGYGACPGRVEARDCLGIIRAGPGPVVQRSERARVNFDQGDPARCGMGKQDQRQT
jgi:hypothetical protein